VSPKTTTTTTVHSRKDSDGEWQEYEKTVVTTRVERDDDGYPYGPVPNAYPPAWPRGRRPFGGASAYMALYDELGAVQARKDEKDDSNG
jgi:hypothetical protein